MCTGIQSVKLSMESRQQIKHEIWKAIIVPEGRISNLEFRKKSDKMKILVMMCLASAIASVTQSDPQPKGKPEVKFKKTF